MKSSSMMLERDTIQLGSNSDDQLGRHVNSTTLQVNTQSTI
jgi:hypothetical protein